MIGLDSRTKTKLGWVGLLLAPVMVVQGVRLVFGVSAAPASASAAAQTVQPTPPAPALEMDKPLTSTQTKARTWLLSRSRTLQPRSPMDYPDPIPPPPAPATPAPIEAPRPAEVIPEATLPPLALTAMIASTDARPAIALINHRMFRVGDRIAGEWHVTGIDTRKRTVTLTGPEGRTTELLQPGPPPER